MSAQDYRDSDLLRFSTAGSVDDGKSTLIGRLLYDTKSIFVDQMEAVEQASRSHGEESVNLALLTDGLRAEREQKITIDVAYRYFATPRRKFIIADTPGHVQYTRNMVTGASTAELAVVLIDARKGVLTQSKRHGFISSLLGLPHIVVAVNKMDLVEWREDVFQEIVRDYRDFAEKHHAGKALAADRAAYNTGHGRLLDFPDARVVLLSEHHAVVDGLDEPPPLGSRVRVVPNHVCAAVNLADTLWADTGDELVPWAVAARGRNT